MEIYLNTAIGKVRTNSEMWFGSDTKENTEIDDNLM